MYTMRKSVKLFFILAIFLIFVDIAFAVDNNSTEIALNDTDFKIDGLKASETDIDNLSEGENSSEIEKTQPVISIDSKSVKSKDTISITFTDENKTGLALKKLTATVNNKKVNLVTNSRGIAKLNINLGQGKYKLTISSFEDENYTAVSKSFDINVSKIATSIFHYSNFVLNNHYYHVCLKDAQGKGISNKKVTFRLNGKTHTKKTNKNGLISVKIKSSSSKLSISYTFARDDYYKASSKRVTFYVNRYTSLKIGNSKLLTGGFLRVYLNDFSKSQYWKKTIKITIGNKKFSKKTNSEGIVVIKPKMSGKTYKIVARFGKYYTAKMVKCYKGSVKDPLNEAIPLKNGIPDIDVMPGNYVLGDGSRTYTLSKAQYREVLKRDSYCLFLNNKLTKYTFFKTTGHPNLNHIIKREKWNVIEKAINQKLVDANKHNYWPGSITVSLKGKSYSYPEIRDWQDTSYTCGPTSCSMCSQVLKNYLCEKYIAKHSGSSKAYGTACSGMVKALEKNNFKCTYYYRNSFSFALNELKKGGCALVFHARNHYVAILDISKDGKKVLVSNSYGSYDDIESKWLTVSYMKTRYYKNYDDGLIVRLNYKLGESTKNKIGFYYSSMGPNWFAKNTAEIVN